jgi:hypothetical protein
MADLKGDGLGYWDPGVEVVIEENQPELGKLIILVHELLHVIDDHLVAAGVTKRRTQHEFIRNAAFPLVAMLAQNGFLKDFPSEEADAFLAEIMEQMPSLDGEGGSESESPA